MSQYTLEQSVITQNMKSEINGIKSSLKYGYKEDKQKIGKMVVRTEFEEYRAMKQEADENGKKWWVHDPNGKLSYNLVLTVAVPLLGANCDFTNVHYYRWDEKRQRFDYENTEIQ